MVDAQRVRNDVPSLVDEYPQEKDQYEDDGRNPSEFRVRCQSVQERLVRLQPEEEQN